MSPIHFGFLYGGKRGPHTKHMGQRDRDLGHIRCVFFTIKYYILVRAPLKETQAKVTFLLILHALGKLPLVSWAAPL